MVRPDLRLAAEEMMKDPKALTDVRYELATLRAYFRSLAFQESDEEGGDESRLNTLMRLGSTITSMADKIQAMEVGRQHYLHVSVTGGIVAAFADIGRRYIKTPEEQAAFQREVEEAIRMSFQSSKARSIATSALTPNIIDVKKKVGADQDD